MNTKIAKKVILTISVIIALCLAALYLAPLQAALIALVERLKNDDIRDVFWKQQMIAFATCGILFLVILNLVLWTKKSQEIFDGFCAAVKQECTFVIQNKKYFIFLLAAYFLGYFTIIRGNFCYIGVDDLPRQMEGCREWIGWYRYIDEIGSILIHTSPRLIDIAPLTQFIAIFFISLASFATVQSATNEKMGYLPCIASLPIGLFPYFLTNMSYRFDSPYMALSVFFVAIPFVFSKKESVFVITSLLGITLMCVSYQASNGIYIILSAFHALKMKKENCPWNKILRHIALCLFCYIAALVFFKLVFMEKDLHAGIVDERMEPTLILKNMETYISLIWNGLGKSALKKLILISMVFNAFLTLLFSQQDKVSNLLLTLFFYAFAFCLSYGVYLALALPLWHPRAMYAIGFYVATILFLLAINFKETPKITAAISKILIFSTSWCCLAFAFAFGNAQKMQNDYAEFRMKLLVNDLSKIVAVNKTDEKNELTIINSIDCPPAVKNLISVYPLTDACIERYVSGEGSAKQVMKSLGFLEHEAGEHTTYDRNDFQIELESAFHTIQRNGNHYLVTLHNEPISVIK